MENKAHGISLFNLLSIMLSWALMSLLFVMFYMACFTPSNQLTITVNEYGEMRIEAVLFALIWIMTTINMILFWKRSSSQKIAKESLEEHLPATPNILPGID
ncbi:MAG: hypothetical protein SVM79_07235 [Chloroflexota bacterium]|nr:hypothetical protein [Chloroflexota bacterium]